MMSYSSHAAPLQHCLALVLHIWWLCLLVVCGCCIIQELAADCCELSVQSTLRNPTTMVLCLVPVCHDWVVLLLLVSSCKACMAAPCWKCHLVIHSTIRSDGFGTAVNVGGPGQKPCRFWGMTDRPQQHFKTDHIVQDDQAMVHRAAAAMC